MNCRWILTQTQAATLNGFSSGKPHGQWECSKLSVLFICRVKNMVASDGSLTRMSGSNAGQYDVDQVLILTSVAVCIYHCIESCRLFLSQISKVAPDLPPPHQPRLLIAS
jgi:hypothetical protein